MKFQGQLKQLNEQEIVSSLWKILSQAELELARKITTIKCNGYDITCKNKLAIFNQCINSTSSL